MPSRQKIIKYLFLLIFVVAIATPLGFLHAADTPPSEAAVGDYTKLAPLPTNAPSGVVTQTGLAGYLQYLFWFAIVSAGILAVLVITYGGVLYMTSEAFNTKAEAKKRITMAIVGFLLAISSVLILTTINPDLLKFNLLVRLVRPLTFNLPPPGAAAGSIPGCTSDASAPIFNCSWALSGGTCSTAILGAYNNWIDLADNFCAGEKPAAYRCCGFVPPNDRGCTGIGVNAGKTECTWVGGTFSLGNLCTNAPFVTTHPGFQQDSSELYCRGTKPGASILGSGSVCCVK